MLYLIHGTDRQKVIAKASDVVAGLRKRRPDAEVFSMTEDGANLSRLQELAGGQGLFESKYIVVLKNLFSRKDLAEPLSELLHGLAVSQNVFIFVEGALLKPALGAFEKAGAQIQAFAAAPKERPNHFALADAFALRDRKRLWVLYVKALRRGASPEELSGMLFWKVKDLLSSGRAARFSADELRAAARRLVALYHDAHRGLTDFETGLERFLLNL